MLQNHIFHNKKNGNPVQIIAKAKTKPISQDVICYQELTSPYEYYVIDVQQFFEEYIKETKRLPDREREQNGEKKSLQERILIEERKLLEERKRLEMKEEGSEEIKEEDDEMDEKTRKMLQFLDADSYHEKMKILEDMKSDLNDHILNNLAVSLDLSLEDDVDGYEMIMSELKIRSKFETSRGDRL